MTFLPGTLYLLLSLTPRLLKHNKLRASNALHFSLKKCLLNRNFIVSFYSAIHLLITAVQAGQRKFSLFPT